MPATSKFPGSVFGAEPIPPAATVIWDLRDTQKFLLRITLAMMTNPQLLLVDGIAQIRSSASRLKIWDRLAWLATSNTSVIVSVSSLDAERWEQLEIAPRVVDLTAHTSTAEPEDAAVTNHGSAV